jgi:hypothetical protein
MAARATTIAQGFSQKVMKAVYDRSLLDSIVNRDYEGEINAVGSKLNILDFDKVSEKTYSNVPLSADSLTENNGQLAIDQYKSFYWKEKTLDNWLSYIKDPHPTIIEQVANERTRNMDLFAFAQYAKVGAGNRVGTDYTTGTVSIDSSGNVTGVGTTFTAGMVGRGLKATGHTKWYRVKTFTNTTTIVVEDDLDDVSSQYTGGVISGATYVIEAVTAVTLTTSNFVQQIAALKLKLDSAERNGYFSVPDNDRYLLVPPEFSDLVVRASGIVLSVPEVYSDLVQKGMIGMLLGFKIFVSNRLSGSNTSGFHCIAGHTGWMTFAEKVLQARIEEDLIGDFGAAYKDLFVYGSKVKDPRRHFATEGFFIFSL